MSNSQKIINGNYTNNFDLVFYRQYNIIYSNIIMLSVLWLADYKWHT